MYLLEIPSCQLSVYANEFLLYEPAVPTAIAHVPVLLAPFPNSIRIFADT